MTFDMGSIAKMCAQIPLTDNRIHQQCFTASYRDSFVVCRV